MSSRIIYGLIVSACLPLGERDCYSGPSLNRASEDRNLAPFREERQTDNEPIGSAIIFDSDCLDAMVLRERKEKKR